MTGIRYGLIDLLLLKLIDRMRGKGEAKVPTKSNIPIETSASITDYQYNHNGTQLAVADSDGIVYVYSRNGQHFQKVSQFKGDDAAIWKVTWGDPSYGDIIALGSFKKKVAIFQSKNNVWSEIAFHEIHEGSVNHVQWASPAFGLKLFSAGSEGSIAILELKKNTWATSSFSAHECSINSLSLRPLALNEDEQERNSQFPMLATVAKDHVVKIWRHTSEIKQELLQKDARIYQQVASYKPHVETIRALLWKKRWTEADPIEYELLTASEDGYVKLASFKGDKLVQTIDICKHEDPVYRISQSITGNILSVSVSDEEEKTYVYAEKDSWKNWSLVEQIQ